MQSIIQRQIGIISGITSQVLYSNDNYLYVKGIQRALGILRMQVSGKQELLDEIDELIQTPVSFHSLKKINTLCIIFGNRLDALELAKEL